MNTAVTPVSMKFMTMSSAPLISKTISNLENISNFSSVESSLVPSHRKFNN